MEPTTHLILPDVIEALRSDPASVAELAEELHPADLAELASSLDDELAIKLVRALPTERAAELLEGMDHARRVQLFGEIASKEVERAAELVEEMAPDERADILSDLGEQSLSEVLAEMPQEDAREIKQLLSYPEGTAGALMTTNFVALPVESSASSAIEQVRKNAEEMETIYDAYAIDPHGTLLGVVSLRDLVIAKGDRKIGDIMTPNVIAVEVTLDQEEVARVIAKYDLFAVPVIDHHRRVVGIVTVDDVIDVIKQEASEDIQKLGGMEALDEPYLQIQFHRMLKKRAGWLTILFLSEMLTATAMGYFEHEISKAVVLALFIPLIISSGGNSGSQASTLVIRAMALGEVRLIDWWRVIRREVAAGLALGVILGTIGLCRIMLWPSRVTLYGEHYVLVAITVAISLIGIVLWGTIAGSMLPFILRKLGFDPASASAPFVATLVDVSGLVIYFTTASLVLRGVLL